MKDRKTIFALLVGAVLLEAVLLVRSGLISWLAAGPHTADQLRDRIVDWRTALSVVLVSAILWLAYQWIRAGARVKARESDDLMSK